MRKMIAPKKNKVASTPRHEQQVKEENETSTDGLKGEDSERIVKTSSEDEQHQSNAENEVHEQERNEQDIPENAGRHELPALPPGFTPSGLEAANVHPNLIALQNQHIRELKAENENIKAKNENLEAQLAAAKEEIAQLEKEEIARLQAVTRRNEQEMDDLNLRVVRFEEENAHLRRFHLERARVMRLEMDAWEQFDGQVQGHQDDA